ncbi:N-acetyltransferase [Paenibacillus curdlanolyticus]|nr:N-acetyltransferase [Paenibacillus curdlanolyticus]
MTVLTDIPQLETQRLCLRRMTQEDAPALFAIFSDAQVTKDMGITPFDRVAQAEEVIRFMNELFLRGLAVRWAIVRKADDVVLGTCGFNGWELQRGARGEIGYDLGRPYWRAGYMTEALTAMISFGFERLGLHRIEAYTNLGAEPSMKLLEKLGFRQEGILRGFAHFHGGYWDQRCYSLLKHEWFPSR